MAGQKRIGACIQVIMASIGLGGLFVSYELPGLPLFARDRLGAFMTDDRVPAMGAVCVNSLNTMSKLL